MPLVAVQFRLLRPIAPIEIRVRAEGRRANSKRVLFQREFTDKLHDAIFDDIGFNADP